MGCFFFVVLLFGGGRRVIFTQHVLAERSPVLNHLLVSESRHSEAHYAVDCSKGTAITAQSYLKGVEIKSLW